MVQCTVVPSCGGGGNVVGINHALIAISLTWTFSISHAPPISIFITTVYYYYQLVVLPAMGISSTCIATNWGISPRFLAIK